MVGVSTELGGGQSNTTTLEDRFTGLTGASPGHSYTVKSPSSFSSSVEAPELGTLGSSLCLQKVTDRVRVRG